MRIAIINGPNLNLLGTREPHIYGNQTFESYLEELKMLFPHEELVYFQSNHEGNIIDFIQQECAGNKRIVINGGAFSHTSIAIADALQSVEAKAVEVHISNVYQRESYRHHSHLAPVCMGCIVGLGLSGYRLAIEFHLQNP